jgi:hypothetical protein
VTQHDQVELFAPQVTHHLSLAAANRIYANPAEHLGSRFQETKILSYQKNFGHVRLHEIAVIWGGAHAHHIEADSSAENHTISTRVLSVAWVTFGQCFQENLQF